MSLTTKQRQYLKGLAHGLTPIVRVGRPGVSESVVEETKRSLEAHELIKVRFDADEGADRRADAEKLAAATGSVIAGSVGKIAVLYRAREEKPKIKLPS